MIRIIIFGGFESSDTNRSKPCKVLDLNNLICISRVTGKIPLSHFFHRVEIYDYNFWCKLINFYLQNYLLLRNWKWSITASPLVVLKHLPQCDWIMMSLCSSITINNELKAWKSFFLICMISFGYEFFRSLFL